LASAITVWDMVIELHVLPDLAPACHLTKVLIRVTLYIMAWGSGKRDGDSEV